MAPRHFIDIADIDAKTLRWIVDAAHEMKRTGKTVPAHLKPPGIEQSVLVMVFEKPSTRTRVSFDVAMRQLGGQTIALNHTEKPGAPVDQLVYTVPGRHEAHWDGRYQRTGQEVPSGQYYVQLTVEARERVRHTMPVTVAK